MGSIRINSSQIDSKVEYANVDLMMTTTVQEVLKDSLKQFGVQVRKSGQNSVVGCGDLGKVCVARVHMYTEISQTDEIVVIFVEKCLTDSHRRQLYI